MELLNSIPCCQRQQEHWEELRAYGVAWWLRNNAALRGCVERVAKNAFQKEQNPMDAALFYLAMKKKNVLTQLFKVGFGPKSSDCEDTNNIDQCLEFQRCSHVRILQGGFHDGKVEEGSVEKCLCFDEQTALSTLGRIFFAGRLIGGFHPGQNQLYIFNNIFQIFRPFSVGWAICSWRWLSFGCFTSPNRRNCLNR